jgi:hypothetical protein
MGIKEAKAKLDAAAAGKGGGDDENGEETSSSDIDLKRKTKPEEGEDVEISLEDDDDEPGETTTAGQSRAEKKKERGRGFAQERDEERAAAQRERDRADRLEASLLEVTRRMAPDKKEEDPLDGEIKNIEKRLEGLAQRAEALGQKITPEQEKEIRAEAADLRRQEGRVNFKIAARESREEEVRRSGGIPPEVRARQAADHASLASDYPELYSYSATTKDGNRYYPGLEWARGEYKKRTAKSGEGLNMKVLRECLKEAEREFGFGSSRDVSAGQRAKFSGVPRGGHGGRANEQKSFTMTPEHRRMANAMYKHVKNEGERFKLYAKKVGKRILEKSA